MLKLQLTEEAFEDLVDRRRAAGLPSVQAYVLQKLGLLTEDAEAKEIVRQAKKRAKEHEEGEEFCVRDLFAPAIWRKFDKSARLRAGRLFYAWVETATDGIRATRKGPAGHQMYARGRKRTR